MQNIYDILYRPGIPLQTMGILIGVWLILTHTYAWLKPDIVGPWLKKFPRNEMIGMVLTVIGFIWTFIIWSCMDLGEFYKIERPVQLIIILGCFGVIHYVKEFLAVRSLAFLMILIGAPILSSAFLKEPTSRLLIVALAYGGIVAGMFWIGIPYLMRDAITWVLAEKKRYQLGAIGGIVFGLVVLVCAILFWGAHSEVM